VHVHVHVHVQLFGSLTGQTSSLSHCTECSSCTLSRSPIPIGLPQNPTATDYLALQVYNESVRDLLALAAAAGSGGGGGSNGGSSPRGSAAHGAFSSGSSKSSNGGLDVSGLPAGELPPNMDRCVGRQDKAMASS
jgi:hypothetical protein